LVDGQDPRTIGAWKGIFIDRTNAAEEMVFMLSPALVGWGRRFKSGRILSIVLLSAMIIKAQAVTAFIALFFFILFLACLRFCRRLEPRHSMAFVVFGSFATVLLAVTRYNYFPEIVRGLGRDPTLTGRTFIWGVLVGSIVKRPLLGYGFYAFWQNLSGEAGRVADSIHWTAGYAHNGILEICLQFGLFGVVIFVVTLIQALRNAWFCIRNDSLGRYDWYLGLIVLTIIYNIDAGTAVYPNELLSILYVVMCCGLAQAVWQIKHDACHEEVHV
jgi:exopolysaccharide production protein ExoQ